MAKNKRAKGMGTIYQRSADGMWVVSLDLPTTEDNKRLFPDEGVAGAGVAFPG